MKPRQSYTVDILLLSALLLPYFIWHLGGMALHTPDEARYSMVSMGMFQSKQYLVPKILGVAFLDKPPLFYYAQVLMLKLFGNAEFTLRLPSVLCAYFSCLMLYVTGHQLFDRLTGYLAAILLATSPLFFAMSHYANLDMMVAAFITGCLCFFILAQQPNRPTARFYMVGAYFCMALAMLTKGLIAVAFPVCICLIYAAAYRIRLKVFPLMGLAIFLVIVAPWFVMMHIEVKGFSYYYFVIQHFYRYLSESFNNQQPFWFYIAIVAACSLPWLFLTLSPKQPDQPDGQQQTRNIRFFAIAFGFIVIFFSIPASKPIGYILPCFPPLAMLLAYQLTRRDHGRFFVVLSSISIVVGILLCYPWPQLHAYHHEITPFALILTVSGCIGLLIQLLFAKPRPNRQANTINSRKQISFAALCLAAMMLINLTGLRLVQSLEHQSIKPIVSYIKQLIGTKRATIAMVNSYYYDLPYYANDQQVLAIADWQKGLFKGDLLTEQFALGMQYHQSANYQNNQTFLKQWRNVKQPMFAVTNEQNVKRLLKENGHLLLSYRGIYLLKNIP